MCEGASRPWVLLLWNRRCAEPKIFFVKLLWCCLVIALDPSDKEPSCLMTTNMNHPHPDGCVTYHIAQLVGEGLKDMESQTTTD